MYCNHVVFSIDNVRCKAKTLVFLFPMAPSAKRGRGAKPTSKPQSVPAKTSPVVNILKSPDLSSIERTSFLETELQNYGNPLHSTAVEEELNISQEVEEERRTEEDGAATQRHGVALPRKEGVEEQKTRGRRVSGKNKDKPVRKGKERAKKMKPNTPQTQNDSDSEIKDSDSSPTSRRRRPPLSSEDLTDEDAHWSPKKKIVRKSGRGRSDIASAMKKQTKKYSSGSGAEGPEAVDVAQQSKRDHGGRAGTKSEVVLNTFLDLCAEYRETVDSTAVRQAIDSFTSNFEQQLIEKITAWKKFKSVVRENAKVESLIKKKRQRLLDAKYQLIRAEQDLQSLQQEEAKLKQRLTDLRRSQTLLHGVTDLNRRHREHRHAHPKEIIEYGVSSLPALLLETRYILGAENQLKRINDQLTKKLEMAGE